MTTSTLQASPLLVWSPGLTQRPNSPIAKLIKEWEKIHLRQNELDHANSWALPGESVDDLDQMLIRAGFNTTRNDSQGDAYLWLLVKQASTDQLAGRIVLQRILPPLLAIARRRGRIMDGGFDAAIAEVLPSAWTVISQYPWQRRLNKVAANLVLDSEYFAFVQGNRSKRFKVTPMDPVVLAEILPEPADFDDGSSDVSLDQLIKIAIQHGIDMRHVEILRAVASGQTAAVIAKNYDIAERTARAWRARAVSELRARTRCEE